MPEFQCPCRFGAPETCVWHRSEAPPAGGSSNTPPQETTPAREPPKSAANGPLASGPETARDGDGAAGNSSDGGSGRRRRRRWARPNADRSRADDAAGGSSGVVPATAERCICPFGILRGDCPRHGHLVPW